MTSQTGMGSQSYYASPFRPTREMRFWVVRFIRENAARFDCSSPHGVIVAGGDEVRGGRVRGHAADRAVVVAEHAVLHALHQVIDLALLVRTTADSVPTLQI